MKSMYICVRILELKLFQFVTNEACYHTTLTVIIIIKYLRYHDVTTVAI